MMFPPPQRQAALTRIDPVVGIRVCRIIFFALMMGLASFMVIVLVMAEETKPAVIAYVGLIFAGTVIAVRFIVPGMVAASLVKKLPPGTPEDLNARLFPVYQQRMIIALALLEGAGFMNCICYLLERQWFSLAIIAVLLILMGMLFPTLNQFENWVEDVKRDLASQF
jgi:hypothetical protein